MNFAAPFDKLSTTIEYAQALADDKGTVVAIVSVHPESAAAACGMHFGVFEFADEDRGDAPVVEIIYPSVLPGAR